MKGAVFLDRDGVINEVLSRRVKFVNKPTDLHILNGVPESIKIFNNAGLKVFIVTNQGGIGLGYMKETSLKNIHKHLKNELRKEGAFIDDIAYCPHRPNAGCTCRKPNPGMLELLANKHHVELSKSIMVGDRDVDIEAGKKVGMKTVLIGNDPSIMADIQFPSLIEATDWIVKEIRQLHHSST